MSFEKNFDIQAGLVAHTESTYFFRVGSDAMIDAGIHIGDKLVVDKAVKPKHKDIVVATIDGQFLVRRFFKAEGRLELRADNDSISQSTQLTGDPDEIWGVVVGVVRKY